MSKTNIVLTAADAMVIDLQHMKAALESQNVGGKH